jgi:hypothetical protein
MGRRCIATQNLNSTIGSIPRARMAAKEDSNNTTIVVLNHKDQYYPNLQKTYPQSLSSHQISSSITPHWKGQNTYTKKIPTIQPSYVFITKELPPAMNNSSTHSQLTCLNSTTHMLKPTTCTARPLNRQPKLQRNGPPMSQEKKRKEKKCPYINIGMSTSWLTVHTNVTTNNHAPPLPKHTTYNLSA